MDVQSDQSVIKILVVNVRRKMDISEYVNHAKVNKHDLLCVNEYTFRNSQSRSANEVVFESESTKIALVRVTENLLIKTPHVQKNHIAITTARPAIVLHFWYISPNDESERDNLHELETLLSKRGNKRTIHTGDFNARTIEMGDTKTTPRGSRLLRAIKTGGLSVVNNAGQPTYRCKSGASIIDWTVCTQDMRDLITWECEPAAYGSDHELITITIRTTKEKTSKSAGHKIAPATFLRAIEKHTKNKTFDTWHQDFQDAVEQAKSETSKKRKPSEEDSEITDIRNEIKKEVKRIKRGECDKQSARERIRELSNLLNTRKEEAEKRKERKLIMNADESILFGRLIKSSKEVGACKFIQIDERQLRGKEAAASILEKFFPNQSSKRYVLPNVNAESDPPITRDEIQNAIKSFKSGKAPGKSGVSIELIHKWFNRDPEYITGLINHWFEAGCFPYALKESMIVMLIKSTSKQSTLNNVRPIALTECLGRLYEKILDTRVMYYIEKNKLLPDSQYGYREKRNAIQLADEVMRDRMKYKETKMKEVLVQLDVKAAFDSIQHVALVKSLLECKLPNNLIKVVVDYLTDRRVTIATEEGEVTRKMCAGVPQGSCLGPHLYILATGAVLKAVERKMQSSKNSISKVRSYADDIVLTIASKRNDEYIFKKADEYLMLIADKLKERGLELSGEKTKVMVTEKKFEERQVTILGKEILTVEHLKLLGINFSADNTSSKHIQEINNKVDEWLRRQKGLLNPHSGLSYDLRKKAINSILIPKITYGAEVWWENLRRADKRMLRSMARKAAAATTAAPKEAGYISTTTLARSTPANMQCQLKYEIHKERSRGEHEECMASYDWGHPSERKSLSFEGTLTEPQQIENLEADIKYFTDGSKKKDEDQEAITGAAYVRYAIGAQPEACLIKLAPENSVFQAELVAIQQALTDILRREAWCLKHAILSDSLSSLEAIANYKSKSPIAHKCRQLLKSIKEKDCEVKLYHVKAHQGLEGNEEADRLANEATTSGTPQDVPKPFSHIKHTAKERVKKERMNEYNQDPSGRTIKQFFESPYDPRLAKITVDPWTSELYTGHGSNRGSHKLGFEGTTDQACECGKEQSVPHLLQDCPLTVTNNTAAAKKVGIPMHVVFGTWDEFSRHKRFHSYVATRARSLQEEIKVLNKVVIELHKAMATTHHLRISEEVHEPLEDAEMNWFSRRHQRRRTQEVSAIHSDQGQVNVQIEQEEEEANTSNSENEETTARYGSNRD